jgi:hypothetical protein
LEVQVLSRPLDLFVGNFRADESEKEIEVDFDLWDVKINAFYKRFFEYMRR